MTSKTIATTRGHKRLVAPQKVDLEDQAKSFAVSKRIVVISTFLTASVLGVGCFAAITIYKPKMLNLFFSGGSKPNKEVLEEKLSASVNDIINKQDENSEVLDQKWLKRVYDSLPEMANTGLLASDYYNSLDERTEGRIRDLRIELNREDGSVLITTLKEYGVERFMDQLASPVCFQTMLQKGANQKQARVFCQAFINDQGLAVLTLMRAQKTCVSEAETTLSASAQSDITNFYINSSLKDYGQSAAREAIDILKSETNRNLELRNRDLEILQKRTNLDSSEESQEVRAAIMSTQKRIEVCRQNLALVQEKALAAEILNELIKKDTGFIAFVKKVKEAKEKLEPLCVVASRMLEHKAVPLSFYGLCRTTKRENGREEVSHRDTATGYFSPLMCPLGSELRFEEIKGLLKFTGSDIKVLDESKASESFCSDLQHFNGSNVKRKMVFRKRTVSEKNPATTRICELNEAGKERGLTAERQIHYNEAVLYEKLLQTKELEELNSYNLEWFNANVKNVMLQQQKLFRKHYRPGLIAGNEIVLMNPQENKGKVASHAMPKVLAVYKKPDFDPWILKGVEVLEDREEVSQEEDESSITRKGEIVKEYKTSTGGYYRCHDSLSITALKEPNKKTKVGQSNDDNLKSKPLSREEVEVAAKALIEKVLKKHGMLPSLSKSND